MLKKAYSVQMSFDVPDAEKRIAEKASESFDELVARLRLASRHLDILYIPFRKHQNYDSEEIMKYRVVLRRYRDQVKENFDEVIQRAYRAILLMGEFSTDTQTVEIMSAFDSQMHDLRKQVNRFLGLFSNIGSADFVNALLISIDLIKKQISQIKQTINDRILEHIDTNILAKNWASTITDEYQNKVYEKMPLVVELFKERQQASDGVM